MGFLSELHAALSKINQKVIHPVGSAASNAISWADNRIQSGHALPTLQESHIGPSAQFQQHHPLLGTLANFGVGAVDAFPTILNDAVINPTADVSNQITALRSQQQLGYNRLLSGPAQIGYQVVGRQIPSFAQQTSTPTSNAAMVGAIARTLSPIALAYQPEGIQGAAGAELPFLRNLVTSSAKQGALGAAAGVLSGVGSAPENFPAQLNAAKAGAIQGGGTGALLGAIGPAVGSFKRSPEQLPVTPSEPIVKEAPLAEPNLAIKNTAPNSPDNLNPYGPRVPVPNPLIPEVKQGSIGEAKQRAIQAQIEARRPVPPVNEPLPVSSDNSPLNKGERTKLVSAGLSRQEISQMKPQDARTLLLRQQPASPPVVQKVTVVAKSPLEISKASIPQTVQPVLAESAPTSQPQIKPQLAPAPVPEPTVPQLQVESSLPGSIEKPRGLVNTLQDSTKTSPEVKQGAAAVNPQTYQSLPNKVSAATAEALISKDPLAAHQYVVNENTPWSAEKSQAGKQLMNQYASQGDIAKVTEIADSMDRQARVAGQGNQALASYGEMAPPNLLKMADASAKNLGKSLPEEFRQQVLTRAAELQKMADGSPEKIQATQALLQDIAAQLPPTTGEWISNYRYQNMLSSPVSAEKVGFGGLFNTLITHPVDLFANATLEAGKAVALKTPYERAVYFSDIPRWYKDLALGQQNALRAAAESFKGVNVDQAMESPRTKPGTIVASLRKNNIPVLARPFSSLHGAIYSYFSSLVAGGERARLMAHGISDGEATAAGKALGDKLTLRSALGSNEGSLAVRAVDGIGNFTSKLHDVPVIGAASQWIAPFMKVSTNWAKLAVEHSPLNLIDDPRKITTDQVAKAFVGSVAVGLGAQLSGAGRVTWAAPSDPTENSLFYASGRKPYSVEVNGHWIPLTYFGAFASALAMPQAVKEATQGQNIANSDLTKLVDSVSNMSKFVVANTPLPAIAGFFNLVGGDPNVNIDKILADTASQAIPLEALQRYVANWIDPVYRKSSTFVQRIESGIPNLTKNNPAYTTPEGVPETRQPSDPYVPYATGKANPTYEPAYQARRQTLQSNAILKAADNNQSAPGSAGGSVSGAEVAPGIHALPDGTFSYQVDNQFKSAKTIPAAQLAMAESAVVNGTADTLNVNGTIVTADPNAANGYTVKTPKQQRQDALDLQTAKWQLDATRAKNADDISGWTKIASQQIQSLQNQIKAATDPVKQVNLQGQLESLQNNVAKYQSYGGFTKPKKPKKISVHRGSLRTFKAPKIVGAHVASIHAKKVTPLKVPKIKLAR